MVTLLDGPAPTPVCALSRNVYTVSGDNPLTAPINMLSVMLITVPSNWIEYCIIMPLGVTGGLHCKVTELELTEIITNELGSLGTICINKSWWYQLIIE